MLMNKFFIAALTFIVIASPSMADETKTYAERLGWPKGAKVVMFHSDDLGMCLEGNLGTIDSLEKGLVTSTSTMMPCPWVPGWLDYLKKNPKVDNGLHLTMTSEWDFYRWGPVAGAAQVPGLADDQGCLRDGVGDVIQNATADEVEMEIRAQIARAEKMGMTITHLDSHMGTLFASPEFFERYVKIGIEKQYPVLIIGKNGYLSQKHEPGFKKLLDATNLHEIAWNGGLPVLDDATGQSYAWKTLEEKKKMFIETIKEIKPGVTEIIVHCTRGGEHFDAISSSGSTRQADLDVMTDPEIIQLVKDEGIILTTWRELMERRQAVKE